MSKGDTTSHFVPLDTCGDPNCESCQQTALAIDALTAAMAKSFNADTARLQQGEDRALSDDELLEAMMRLTNATGTALAAILFAILRGNENRSAPFSRCWRSWRTASASPWGRRRSCASSTRSAMAPTKSGRSAAVSIDDAGGMPTPREIIAHQGERARALVRDIAETQRGISAKCIDWEREAHRIATGIRAALALLDASEAERRRPSGDIKPTGDER